MEIFVNKSDFIKTIPIQPGVYRFYAKDELDATNNKVSGELLYVGKAINLAKRVKSYFQKSQALSPRISLMVKKIYRIELTITDNEVSALLLENNLIKTLKPKYNIIFRDDKTYPLIRLTNHEYPKIDSYRGKNTGDNYFGPYPNAYAVRYTIDTIQNLFKLRTCSDSFFNHRSRPCMLYQIKRCTAPCVGYVGQEEYAKQVNLAIKFLQGDYNQIVTNLNRQMNQAANNLEFELAASIRDKISMLRQISTDQIMNNHKKPINADIVLAKSQGGKLFVYVINLRQGIYSGDCHFVLPNPDDDLPAVLAVFLEGHYLEQLAVNTIYVDTDLDDEFLQMFTAATKIKVTTKLPMQIKRLYTSMGQVNLGKVIDGANQNSQLSLAAERLAGILNINEIHRIECIDVSHTGGANAQASLVVYEDGVIDSSKYRRYNLPDSIGGDDLLGIKTMLERRLKAQNLALPQVILVDGGINQFNLVKNMLSVHELCDKIRVVSIYKGVRRDPKFDRVIIDQNLLLESDGEPLVFKLLQMLRDEAHRFAITGHRKKQIKTMAVSKINDIANIGDVKKRALITHFGSIRGVANASIEDLKQISGIGDSLASAIYYHFH